MKRYLLLLCWLAALPLSSALAQTQTIKSEQTEFNLQIIAEGLGVPWGMAFISNNQLLITEREGNVRLLDTKTGAITPIKGSPDVLASGQGGLLDVAVPPDFKPGGWIYFTFVRDKDGDGVTVLARAKLQSNTLVQWQDLLETQSLTDTGRHFGSRIAFDEQGYIYFGVGDRGDRPNSQDRSNHAGSVMRLHRDGRVPADNPYVQSKEGLPEIWSYGHRNPQGMAYDFDRKRLWLVEHGPRGGDEINLVLKGRNYGWPIISYGKEYWAPMSVGEGTHREGMEQPVKQYTPSIAPGSMLLYSGDAFPEWRGNLFVGALKLQHINRVTLDEQGQAIGEERLLSGLRERIRSLTQSPEGWLYFASDRGRIYVIKPAG